MKKLYELGAKTGLSPREVNKVARGGWLGLLALGLAALAGCFRAQGPSAAVPASKPGTVQGSFDTVDQSTGAAKPLDQTGAGSDCGPYPGYPCGTRYYTVGRADFGRAQSRSKTRRGSAGGVVG